MVTFCFGWISMLKCLCSRSDPNSLGHFNQSIDLIRCCSFFFFFATMQHSFISTESYHYMLGAGVAADRGQLCPYRLDCVPAPNSHGSCSLICQPPTLLVSCNGLVKECDSGYIIGDWFPPLCLKHTSVFAKCPIFAVRSHNLQRARALTESSLFVSRTLASTNKRLRPLLTFWNVCDSFLFVRVLVLKHFWTPDELLDLTRQRKKHHWFVFQ